MVIQIKGDFSLFHIEHQHAGEARKCMALLIVLVEKQRRKREGGREKIPYLPGPSLRVCTGVD